MELKENEDLEFLESIINEDGNWLLDIRSDENHEIINAVSSSSKLDLATMSRFASTSRADIESRKVNRIPEKTRLKSEWAHRIFQSWHSQWKVKIDGPLKVLVDLHEMTNSDLNYCLEFFVSDVRKTDGTKYPPRTLKEIIAALQHFINNYMRDKRNISLFKDEAFSGMREILDAEMKVSASEGLIRPKRKAKAITLSLEDELWKRGSFGNSNPKQLIDSLIYHIGLHLALRAISEHRNLEYGANSQITLKRDHSTGKEYLQYVERTSKNKTFGIKNSRMEPKVTYIYPNEENPERCVVELYKCYVEHRPESNGKEGCSAFYLTPMQAPVSKCWFKACPMGKNTIGSALKRLTSPICNENDFYSNTSLRRTAKTRIVSSGISREVAQRKTGHVSNADNGYISTELLEASMSKALYGKNISTSQVFNINCVGNEEVNVQSTSCADCTPTAVLEKNGATVKFYL